MFDDNEPSRGDNGAVVGRGGMGLKCVSGKGEFFDPRLIPVKIASEAVKVALKTAELE